MVRIGIAIHTVRYVGTTSVPGRRIDSRNRGTGRPESFSRGDLNYTFDQGQRSWFHLALGGCVGGDGLQTLDYANADRTLRQRVGFPNAEYIDNAMETLDSDRITGTPRTIHNQASWHSRRHEFHGTMLLCD